MAARELDRNGRYKKDYLEHHNPYLKWSEEKFIRKYRLSKARVQEIARDFGPYSRTKGTKVGGGLSYIEQVSNSLISCR